MNGAIRQFGRMATGGLIKPVTEFIGRPVTEVLKYLLSYLGGAGRRTMVEFGGNALKAAEHGGINNGSKITGIRDVEGIYSSNLNHSSPQSHLLDIPSPRPLTPHHSPRQQIFKPKYEMPFIEMPELRGGSHRVNAVFDQIVSPKANNVITRTSQNIKKHAAEMLNDISFKIGSKLTRISDEKLKDIMDNAKLFKTNNGENNGQFTNPILAKIFNENQENENFNEVHNFINIYEKIYELSISSKLSQKIIEAIEEILNSRNEEKEEKIKKIEKYLDNYVKNDKPEKVGLANIL
uniref:Uncharacterized protein n=1 Tax=Meloidogyne hapla TaxID=6305 RepID=A0A1I8AYB0_MELHA